MIRFMICGILILLPIYAVAESLDYAIYEHPLFFGGRKLIEAGTRVYSHDDIHIDDRGSAKVENWAKTLSVSKGFSIGASVYREQKINGFGLWMQKDGKGFSWEWFELEAGNIFCKLQGKGRVKVRLNKIDGLEELASIEFLDDVTFRLNTLWLIPFLDKDSHTLIVKKGSVLLLAPIH